VPVGLGGLVGLIQAGRASRRSWAFELKLQVLLRRTCYR